jgi:hypothetical protein
MTPNQPGGGDGEKRACLRKRFGSRTTEGRASPGNVWRAWCQGGPSWRRRPHATLDRSRPSDPCAPPRGG